ncbi:MAG TPA: glycosyltransferase 87 family protein [Acidimicrobiales bacterium]|nr:glycosyltransferase 87 family protein [Acidimicrobiales bacterium]
MSTSVIEHVTTWRPHSVRARERLRARWADLSLLKRDATLYLAAGVFAWLLGAFSTQPAQWQWGYLTVAPYFAAGVLALVSDWRWASRTLVLRVALLVIVLIGAVAVPLGLEARWRHAQPEVSVIERSGQALVKGQDPYRAYERQGHLVNQVPGVPAFESFFPYFPLMGVFGLPSAETQKGKGLTDARIIMTLMTLILSGWALKLLRIGQDAKIRVAQVLLALPTGALFLSTGGDDMPILALSLLGVAALQRRRSNLVGISLGVAAALKLTAWPLAMGSLLVVRNGRGRSTWLRVLLWITAIVLVTVVPFVVRAPHAFVANVFAFPLGLAGVRSPAASALPGHLLSTWWPIMGHVLTPAALVIGGYFATRYVQRHWPLTLSRLLGLLSVAFLTMMCVASATRVGYVIYPLNFALWASVVSERPVGVGVEAR